MFEDCRIKPWTLNFEQRTLNNEQKAMTTKPTPIGHHDFERVITCGLYYVDKTLLIKEIEEVNKLVYLLPRPRRFGKTLNMMMLRSFFEKKESNKAHLFEGLAIAKEEKLMALQGQFPVVWLSFKDVKGTNWELSLARIKQIISSEYDRHRYLATSSELIEEEKIYYQSVYRQTATISDLENSILTLCRFLYLHHGKKPYLLIDEYDTPINTAYCQGYYQEAISLLKNLYGESLKDNPYLERAVLTGIFRVAQESIFSGLNNLKVSTMLDSQFADKFGFTQPEVDQMLIDFDLSDHTEEVKNWYNGYIFGEDIEIYNPWSILNYLDNPKHALKAYWVNTSSNDLVKQMLSEAGVEVKQELEVLLAGGTLEKRLTENIIFAHLATDPDAIWNFLLFAGYLKVIEQKLIEPKMYGVFMIPNIEIKSIFHESVLYWFEESRTSNDFNSILKCLKQANLKDFSKYFADFIRQVCSVYDFADKEPERVYHAIVLGMMVNLQSDYKINSNRESGYGRYDIVLHPLKKELPAYVFEFKKYDAEDEASIQETLQAAMNQIKTKEYATVLQNEKCENIHLVAIGFKGKEVKMISEKLV